MLRNSKLLPLDVTEKDWIIQTQLSYEQNQELKHVGRWAFAIPKNKLNETWKYARRLYKNDELVNCRYLMCSTGADTKSKNGTIMFFYEGSKNETLIKEYGHKLIEILKYKPPSDVNAIYYKSKTVGAEKKFLYRIELPQDDSDSD